MIDEFKILYVNKLLQLHRYKKNLIVNKQLEQDLIILSCYYRVLKWVNPKKWPIYHQKLALLLKKKSDVL